MQLPMLLLPGSNCFLDLMHTIKRPIIMAMEDANGGSCTNMAM
jgi:hypothetical protein